MAVIELGDCLQVLASMPDATVDAVVTDPPYGLEFMGKEWDRLEFAGGGNDGKVTGTGINRNSPRFYYQQGQAQQEWHEAWARVCLRVLKPGGHLLAFGGTRTYHRLAAGIEDAGLEIRDCLVWLYGSGFPKSLDVSKAIDSAQGIEPEGYQTNPAERPGNGADATTSTGWAKPSRPPKPIATGEDARTWQGWGTALKPAHEPIVLARKPLAGTVAANVLEHGTGALNVDGCRIGIEERFNPPTRKGATVALGSFENCDGDGTTVAGRWPANVVLDPGAAAMLDEQAPDTGGGGFCGGRTFDGELYGAPAKAAPQRQTGRVDENGGASRFFYCAKTSSAERNAGLDGFGKGDRVFMGSGGRTMVDGEWVETHSEPQPRANVHPTVKPIELMRWLCRLVTPPGGLVLDPFAGSGTTGIAAGLERLRFVGIEREADYVAIARARLAWWAQHPDGMTFVRRWELDDERRARAEAGQLTLDLADAEPRKVGEVRT